MTGDLYVVLEHNQAGGLPRVAEDDVHLNYDDAAECAAQLQEAAAPRRDRYSVARLDMGDDW